MKTKGIGAVVIPACACLLAAGAASAQQDMPERYVYATYSHCDFSKQDRADEIFRQVDKPVLDAAVKDGTISLYSYLAHVAGGQWRRVNVIGAGSVQAVLDAQKAIGERMDANEKNSRLATERNAICSSHDDYIWRAVAGNIGTANRGSAAFSTYYVCDQRRESQADAIVKSMIAPTFDQMVADGRIRSWGWLEHIVGGKYRRVETFSADDVGSLMKARAAIIEAYEDNPAGDLLTDICGEHTDYIWEIKAQAP
jgi:lysozyme family protein